jgi:hypothetical protein
MVSHNFLWCANFAMMLLKINNDVIQLSLSNIGMDLAHLVNYYTTMIIYLCSLEKVG